MERTRTDHVITLEETLAIYDTLKRATGEGFIAINERHIIVLANAELERMWGYMPGKLVGQPVQILQPRRYRSQHTSAVRSFVAENKQDTSGHWSYIEALHKDGHEFPIFIRIAKVHHEGRFLLAAAVRDATTFYQARRGIEGLLAEARESKSAGVATLEAALAALDQLQLADPDE